jgi:bifunctional DNA-binding transcriptional regulator/antitoxin component of YhaV-PrlF toxin-antitoxin module
MKYNGVEYVGGDRFTERMGVIPAELRRKYHWNIGDRVKVVDYGGVERVVPVLENPEDWAVPPKKIANRTMRRDGSLEVRCR